MALNPKREIAGRVMRRSITRGLTQFRWTRDELKEREQVSKLQENKEQLEADEPKKEKLISFKKLTHQEIEDFENSLSDDFWITIVAFVNVFILVYLWIKLLDWFKGALF